MSAWDAKRIEELRQVARATSAVSGSRGDDAAFGDAVTPDVVLSLLDELERERRSREILLRDAAFLLEVADFAKEEPGIVGTDTWIGAADGVRFQVNRSKVP